MGHGEVDRGEQAATSYASDRPVEEPPTMPGEAQLRAAATGFALLSDPSRLSVLWVLAHGEADVGTLAERTGVRATAVSQHLAKLRLAGLVAARRDGRRQVYSVPGGHVRRLVLEALGQAEHQITGIPDHD